VPPQPNSPSENIENKQETITKREKILHIKRNIIIEMIKRKK